MVTINQSVQDFLYKQTHIRICSQWHAKQRLQERHWESSIEVYCLILCANLKKYHILTSTYQNNLILYIYKYLPQLIVNIQILFPPPYNKTYMLLRTTDWNTDRKICSIKIWFDLSFYIDKCRCWKEWYPPAK